MADAIFISYRRDDSEGEAGRLFDDLTRAFGNDAVFMDVAGIKPGVDFRKAIEDNVATCGVLLAIVGPQWATITNPNGQRRLEDPSDFVSLEIASALRREVPVIPILVHDARMPSPDLLPERLKNFAFHNSVELSHARWGSDVALLIEALKAYVTPTASAEAPIHATVPVQLPAPHPPSGSGPSTRRNLPVTLGVLALVLIVLVIGFVVLHPGRDKADSAATSASTIASQPAASAPTTPSDTTPVPAATAPPSQPAATAPSTAPAAAPRASSPAPPPSDPGFAGSWKLATPGGNNDTLTRLIIARSPSDGSFSIHAFGGCQAPSCDWGQQAATLSGTKLVATFSPSPSGSDTSRTAMLTVDTNATGLDVLIQNTFENPAGERKNFAHRLFVSAQ